jgi:Autographiviridae endonuclease VII
MCAGGSKKPYCKECRNAYERKNYDPAKDRKRHMKYWYGLSNKEYNQILIEQDYKCQICEVDLHSQKKINVDHNHDTGQIRSILCVRCNLSIGLIEDKEWIEKALEYLKFHEENSANAKFGRIGKWWGKSG